MKLTTINKKFKQGIYKPINCKKYRGNDYPRFLSSWELKLFRWCDMNEDVVEWSSEGIAIPYLNPITEKTSCYFPDVAIKMNVNGVLKKFLVEIKPYRQTIDPKTVDQGKKRKKTIIYENLNYLKNQAKWEAAKKFAIKHNYEFTILTEKELGILKYENK
jgi:hypothetical protein